MTVAIQHGTDASAIIKEWSMEVALPRSHGACLAERGLVVDNQSQYMNREMYEINAINSSCGY